MEHKTLITLIKDKGFDQYIQALQVKCEAEGIDFASQYSTAGDALTVWLNFGNIPATIIINIDGTVSFTYFEGGGRKAEKFKNFTEEDFHLLVSHAFFYLRDSNFEQHKAWHAGLVKTTNL